MTPDIEAIKSAIRAATDIELRSMARDNIISAVYGLRNFSNPHAYTRRQVEAMLDSDPGQPARIDRYVQFWKEWASR